MLASRNPPQGTHLLRGVEQLKDAVDEGGVHHVEGRHGAAKILLGDGAVLRYRLQERLVDDDEVGAPARAPPIWLTILPDTKQGTLISKQ